MFTPILFCPLLPPSLSELKTRQIKCKGYHVWANLRRDKIVFRCKKKKITQGKITLYTVVHMDLPLCWCATFSPPLLSLNPVSITYPRVTLSPPLLSLTLSVLITLGWLSFTPFAILGPVSITYPRATLSPHCYPWPCQYYVPLGDFLTPLDFL